MILFKEMVFICIAYYLIESLLLIHGQVILEALINIHIYKIKNISNSAHI